MNINDYRTKINELINSNGNGGITGAELKEILNMSADVIEALIPLLSKVAIALSPTDPAPTADGWYKPTVAGTYANAGGLVAQSGYDTLFFKEGATWKKVETVMPKGADGANGKTIETWTAKVYASGSQVFHLGKIWENSAATVAGDVPGTAAVWVERLGESYESLYQKMQLPQFFPTYTAVNKLANNDFATVWGGSSATFSVANNIETFTATAANGQIESPITGNLQNDIWYFKIDVKATSNLVRVYVPGATSGSIYSSGSGNWEKLSFTFTAPIAGNLSVRVRDTRASGWDAVQAKKGVAVNLTQVFGAGKEPTKEQFEAMLAGLPDLWFGSTTSVMDKNQTIGKTLVNRDGVVVFENTANQQLKGKKIVCLGDSITEFGNYPEIVASLTGATVYDASFGGTRMVYTGNVADYDDLSGVKLIDAIVSGNWAAQDTAVANLKTAGDDNTVNYNTLKSIVWSEIDYILFMWGTNDYKSIGVTLGNTTDTTTTKNINGALNHIYTQINTNFPKIEVKALTPIFRPGDTPATTNSDDFAGSSGLFLWQIADAIKAKAKQYHAPCLDLYNESIINKHNYAYYIADGTHPTPAGYTKIGEKVARFLLSS